MIQTNFTNLSAEDVLDASFLPEYKKRKAYFYSELVELNVIIFLAEKILRFPFELFEANPNENIFFIQVMRSFYDSVILLFSRLVNDSSGDFYSLRQFKNDVRNAMRKEYRSEFDKLLKEISFTQGMKDLFEAVRKIRNNEIAHKTKEYIFSEIKLTRPNIDQIKKLRDSLNKYLDVLSFDVEHLMLPIPYSDKVQRPAGVHEQTDIDKLLDCIAKNSVILNLPEREPQSWKYRKERLTEEAIAIINEYRQKFGLPIA
jgi:hypothetical protein